MQSTSSRRTLPRPRQKSVDCTGSWPSACLLLVNRSSSAAATTLPSATKQAAASCPNTPLKPSTIITLFRHPPAKTAIFRGGRYRNAHNSGQPCAQASVLESIHRNAELSPYESCPLRTAPKGDTEPLIPTETAAF